MKAIDGTDAPARSRELRKFATKAEKLLRGSFVAGGSEASNSAANIGSVVTSPILPASRRSCLSKRTDRSMAMPKIMTYGAMPI